MRNPKIRRVFDNFSSSHLKALAKINLMKSERDLSSNSRDSVSKRSQINDPKQMEKERNKSCSNLNSYDQSLLWSVLAKGNIDY